MNRETEVLDFIDSIPRGETFLDLGAWEGRFAIYAALRGVWTVAFEPESANYEVLSQNILLNSPTASNLITPHKLAIGSHTHTAILQIGQPWAGGHQRVVASDLGRNDLDFTFVEDQSVDVVALDEMIRKGLVPMPQHMKIDVDGSELSFLRGAKKTVENPQLRTVIFELFKGQCFDDIVGHFDSVGLKYRHEHEVEPGLVNVTFGRDA